MSTFACFGLQFYSTSREASLPRQSPGIFRLPFWKMGCNISAYIFANYGKSPYSLWAFIRAFRSLEQISHETNTFNANGGLVISSQRPIHKNGHNSKRTAFSDNDR
jgi:hypothetical protein